MSRRIFFPLALSLLILGPACQSVGGGQFVGRGEFDDINRRVERLERSATGRDPNRPVVSSPRDKRENALAAAGIGSQPPTSPSPAKAPPVKTPPAQAVPPAANTGLKPPAGVTSGKGSAALVVSKNDKSAYERGQTLLKQKKYDQAAEVFRGLLAQNPSGPLAPNARYWLGECHYAKGEYSQAAVEFQRCARDYPASDKAPDALLKLSYSYDRLGDGPQAMNALDQLLSRYPNSNAASLMKSGQGGFGH